MAPTTTVWPTPPDSGPGGYTTGMDPAFIAQADWHNMSRLLFSLWLILGSALGFGGSMLLAHGMVPSLASTRDIPAEVARKTRPPLYAAALLFLGLGLIGVFLFVDRVGGVTAIFNQGAQ
ncbi:MAG: hypothetical protein V3S98_08775 [Dehalococcoidia bacterium]